MSRQFFENTTKSPKTFYGVTLMPGEGKYVDVPDPAPAPQKVAASVVTVLSSQLASLPYQGAGVVVLAQDSPNAAATLATWNGTKYSSPVSGAWNVVLTASMSAAEVTAAIQTALDGGNKRVVVSGNGSFPLSDRLYIDDSTTFVIEQGCKLVGPAALYYPGVMMGLVVNRQMMSPRTTVTMTSSGNTCTVGWTAHGKSVGETIMLLGSVTRGYNGVYRVASVPNADSLTVTLETVPDATTAVAVSWGALQACAANRDITVVINGELNGNGANQPAPGVSPTDRYLGGVFLSGVLRPRITGTGTIRDCKGYSILISGATFPRVASLEIQSIYRDGAHFQGPIRHLRVEGLTGYSYDDFTSLTTGDLQSLEITEGEIENVVIEKIDAQCSQVGAIGAMFGKSAWWFSDIVYKDLRSPVTGKTVHLKFIGSTASQYNLDQTRFIGKLTVDGVLYEASAQTDPQSAVVAFGSGCSMQDVDIKNIRMIGSAPANYGLAVLFGNSGTTWGMRHLLIEGLYSSSVGSSASLIQGGLGGTTNVESITLRDCSPTVPDNRSFFDLNGMTVEALNVENFTGQLGSASNMLRLAAGTVNYVNVRGANPKITNYGANNWGELVYLAGAVFKAIRFIGCTSNAYRYVQSTSAMYADTSSVIAFIGCRRNNGKLWANLNKGVRIVTDGCEEVGASGNVLWLRGSTKYTLVEGSLISEVTTPIAFFDTATMDIFSPNRRVDITAPGTTGINRAEGATCWNTNAALGTLGTAGPVVCLGTAANSWKRVGNNSLTY
ncbi:hypothetical protein [Roseateles sp. LKC17W]|uniref:Uncharacterized protein n=1 Tax=Pelomonas margarita TaxID=3299031 RepID=A0ABW7FGK4_9BURK